MPGLARNYGKRRTPEEPGLLRRFWLRTALEVVAQTELHAAWDRQQGAGDSNVSAGQPCPDGGGIEAHGVGDVVDLPCKLQAAEVAELPVLGHTGVDVEVAIATEVIPLTRLTGVGQADRPAGSNASVDGGGVVEELRVSVGIEMPAHFYLPCDYAEALDLPIRSEERRVGKECRSRW